MENRQIHSLCKNEKIYFVGKQKEYRKEKKK